MRKPKRIPRTCHMVVAATRRNPYITCTEEPVEGENFCQRHKEYLELAEAEYQLLRKERGA